VICGATIYSLSPLMDCRRTQAAITARYRSVQACSYMVVAVFRVVYLLIIRLIAHPTTSALLVYLWHLKVHCDLPVRSRCASFASLCTNTLLCNTEFLQYALNFSPTLLRANRGQDTLVLAVCISRQSDLKS